MVSLEFPGQDGTAQPKDSLAQRNGVRGEERRGRAKIIRRAGIMSEINNYNFHNIFGPGQISL